MNIQIEHLENHAARLTVDVNPERLDRAMQVAAKRIGSKVNIPGFRKGKAPYNVILRYVGQQALMEEALDDLGNEVYREVLEESQIKPYAPGNLEDLKTEPTLQFIFTVPKQPEITLQDHRSIRLPYEAPVVTDEEVSATMRRLQEQHALVEPIERPAQLEDLVKLQLYGEVIHPEHEAAETEQVDTGAETGPAQPEDSAAQPPAEAGTDEDAADPEEDEEEGVEVFVDDEMEILLTADKDEEFMPGFSVHITGMSAGEEKSFSLAFPDDYEDKEYAGHTFTFRATVQEVKSRILPVLNDDFARRVTNDEIDNLLDLRIRVRKNLEEAAKQEAEASYADAVLDKLVEMATIHYPEEMVVDYTSDILESLDQNLRERGLSLERLMQIQNKTEEDLRTEYRDMAIDRLKRGLVLRELVKLEQLDVSSEDLDAHIETMSRRFSNEPGQIESFRRLFNRPETRRNIASDMVMRRLNERLVAIARGEEPPLGPVAEMTETAPATEAADAAAVDSTPVDEAAPESAGPGDTPAQAEASAEETAEDETLDTESLT